jgi:peptidyl-prolyl cis-trans isomerase D
VNRVTSFIGALAVIAIAVVFVTSFGPGGGQSVQSDPSCAVEVLGNCVKTTHYRASLRLMSRMVDSETGQKLDLSKKTMDGLIEREFLLIEAKKFGLSVSDEAVTRELRAGRFRFSVPAGLPLEQRRFIPTGIGHGGFLDVSQGLQDPKTKAFSAEKYKKLVGDLTGMLEPDFREFQRQELIADRMRLLILARVQVSEAEAKSEFLADYSTAKVAFTRIRPAFYVDRAIDLAPASVQAWADKNATEVEKAVTERKKELAGECREVSHIMLLSKPGPDAEARKAKLKAKLEQARKRVEGGEKFADVARELSQDRGTRKNGGSLGCIMKDEMKGEMKPFSDALYSLSNEGDLSAVIDTKQGLHLLRLDKKHTGADAETAIRQRVSRELFMLAEGKRMASEGAKEIQAAVKGGKSLDDAVKDHLAKYPEPAPPKKEEPKKDEESKKGEAGDKKKDGDKKTADKKDDKEPVKAEEPTTDDDFLVDLDEESIVPKVEKSKAFTSREEPFEGAAFGETPGATVFASTAKAGEPIDKLINLGGGGFAVLVVLERTNPTDAEWAAERDKYLEPRRLLKRKEAISEYVQRLRDASAAEIKITEEFKPKSLASAGGSAVAPPSEEE